MNRIKKTLFAPSVLVLIDQVIFSGTNFFLTLFLGKYLDIKNFGVYATILIVTYLMMSIAQAFIVQPFQVLIATVSSQKQYSIFLFFTLLFFLFIFFLLAKSLFYLFPQQSVYSLNATSVVCFVIGYLIQDFFRKFLLGVGNLWTALFIDVNFLLLVFFLFYFFKSNLDLNIILWVLGIANIISSFPGLVLLLKNFEFPSTWKIFLRSHISQSKWLLSVAVIQWCAGNFFVLVSGIYLGIEALAALRLVQSLFGILNILLQTVENYYLPKVALLYQQNIAAAKNYLLDITLKGALLFAILLSILFIFSKQIIIWAGGQQYQEYGYVIKIIATLYFFIFLSYPIRIAVRVLMLNKIFFIGYLLSFLCSLLTFHYLLKFTGLYGAVAGLIMNQIVMILYWKNQLIKKHFLLWK